jgi:hypothetical protein
MVSPGRQWLMPVILATQEPEKERIVFQSQPKNTVLKIPSPKLPEQNGQGVW